jgi:LmbE family N-acetylglucosaminyl deacetylase
MITKADVMVVSPHPDDAEFMVAGTVARWAHDRKVVVYVICTNGDKGTSDRDVKPEELAKTREREQLAAANLLGVKNVIFLRYPDQGLEYTNGFRKKLVRLIRKYQPGIVITDDPYRRYMYWHRDHRITARITLDAVFPYARDHLSYPDLIKAGLEPHKVKEVLLWGSEEPNYRSDITDTFDIKIAALRCHNSQVGDGGSFHMEGWLREWAEEQARGEDFELAESFHRIEMW